MTKRIRAYLNSFRLQRIRSRFLTAMIAVSLPPLIVLGYVSFNIAKDTLVDNHIETIQSHLKTSSEMADLLFKSVIDMNRIILSSDELRQQLDESGNAEGTGAEVIDVTTANRLQNLVVTNLFDTQYIQSICLFDRKFRSACYGRSELAGPYGSEGARGLIAGTDWYLKSLAANGKEVFFGYNVLEEDLSGDSFSSVKILRDPNQLSGPNLGFLVINIRRSLFSQTVNEGEDSGFWVLDADREPPLLVYDHHPELTAGAGIGQEATDPFRSLTEAGYLYSRYLNATSGWQFVHYVREETLLKQSNRIGTFTMLLAAFMAVIALLVSYFVSGSITRPLLQLKKMIVDWAKGHPAEGSKEAAFVADEVGVIGQTFRRLSSEYQLMGERLLQSQLKEREAELRSLQSQIKPHFLYNTLDSIYWMALLEEKQDIAQMALSLSESFKLSLNKGKETIPVFKELKHIEHYMIIQNLRYDNRFRYIADIDPEIMGYEIMKLLLQPLVENSIYHGLEPKVGSGTITLTGRKEGEALLFAVADDGVGMEDIGRTEQGYGIRNVKERLALYYGEGSSFVIESKPGEGTRITMRLPRKGRGEGGGENGGEKHA
ncbi:sensor histidine kinase [Cohnella fermenti]|uniref:Sensor histidine kinase n=1 Tax=Cohnella fermenti TaxID=2565925 RepID=A0A4S4C6Q0_9BACL|nr:sensor histidine kinase [Cohnella fermenti]THF83278.1 sensor histidine kinase [Cohnella fermenti]